MINILLGAPGGGKSYEAVVYHVLPALQRGRKVITNLPLVLAEFEAIEPGCSALIELRTGTLAVAPDTGADSGDGLMSLITRARASKFVPRAFANPEDFASDWRHADGIGPLYIVDECHFCMPRGGTSRGVEEWFSMHRHFNADVLLITQSAGKISAAIKDLVQVCYKVRKAVAFGKPNSYIRKVLDGVNGGEVAVAERKYKPQMFKLYKSHTQGMAVGEVEADDVAPFIVKFRRYTYVVIALGLLLLVGVFLFGGVKKPAPVVKPPWFDAAVKEYKASPPNPNAGPAPSAVASLPAAAASAAAAVIDVVKDEKDPEPYANKGIHVSGSATMGNRTIYTFTISQNGLPVSYVTDSELAKTGYKWASFTHCTGLLTWHDKVRAVTCDVPAQSMGMVHPSTG